MKLPTLSSRFWVALSTLAVIGALFAYYLLVYVHLREEKLRVDKYRALARYGVNMIQTRLDYSKALRRIRERGNNIVQPMWKQYFKNADEALKTNFAEFIEKRDHASSLNSPNQEQSCCCCNNVVTAKPSKDDDQAKVTGYTRSDSSQFFWSNNRIAVRQEIDKLVKTDFKDVTYEGNLPRSELDSLQHYNFDKIYFSFESARSNRLWVFSMLTKDFVYRPKQFDEFFIIKEFDRTFHEHGKTPLISANETFQTFQNQINLQSVDSFLVREKGLLTSHFGEVKFADTRYELFVHSIKFSEGENWLLCGLLEKGNYNYTVRAVNPLVITAAVLTLLFLIVAMPILKPLIMNRFERLGFVNVWLAGFSIAYGGALLFLLIWSGSHNLQSNEKADDELKDLSTKVKSRFEGELRNIYAELDMVKTQVSAPLTKALEATCRETLVYGNVFTSVNATKHNIDIKRVLEYVQKSKDLPYFNYLLWIDSVGTPRMTLTSQNVEDDYPMPNLLERKYFSRARNDSLWYLPDKNGKADTSKAFALQSIQSWTNHQPEAGFGIVYKDAAMSSPIKVLAMSTRLSSVMDPALPVGFGFCIIDNAGEVWFHSNTRKNHQENIFMEVEHHGKLTSAVKGRAATFFSTEYDGERTRMYVQPLTDMPLHLVVFHDKDYQRTPVVLTIFFAFAFLIAIIVVQVVQLVLLYACEYTRRKLQRKGYFLAILRPSKEHAEMYRTSIAAQSTLLIMCLVLYWFNHFVMIVGFVTLPIMLMVFHQIIYKDELKDKTFIFSIASLGLILLINLAISNLLAGAEVWFAVFEQLVFATVLVLFILLRQPKTHSQLVSAHGQHEKKDISGIRKTVNLLKEHRKVFPKNYYTFMLLTFVLTSIFPVIFFYKIAHWEESLFWSKYKQLEAMESANDRERMLNTSFRFLHNRQDLLDSARSPGNYLPTYDTLENEESTWGNTFEEQLFQAWPQLSDPVGISSAAVFNKALDEKWTWRKSRDEVEITYKEKKKKNLVDVHYTAPLPTFNPFAGEYGFWMLLISLLSLYLLHRVIRFCVKYFFGIGLIPDFQQPSMLYLRSKLLFEHRNVYLTQLPGCTKAKLNSLKQLSTITLVQLFEQGINDHVNNQKILAHLTDLTARQNPPIVVVAPVQPSAIVEIYRKWLNEARANKSHGIDQQAGEKVVGKITEYEIALRQWSNVFKDFEVYYLSITPKEKKILPAVYMNSEMNASVYLQNLGEKMRQYNLEEDDFIINVEEVAEPYYASLWNSFSPDEKLMLFDLAQDRFANMKNHRILRILMQKGVIVNNDDGLGIMNRSFSNFIINVFRNDEEIKITQTAHAQGSWQTIQLVLVLVLAAIVTFIALAQKEFFGNINAVIVAATSAVALFSKFGGLFGSGSKSKE